MEKIFFTVPNSNDITFTGVKIAESYNSKQGITIQVFETAKENWLVAFLNRQDHLVRHIVIENKKADELTALLGFDETAKEVYEQIGLNTSKNLDI
ncbi:hypothetical protein PNF54_004133 [Cronobacter sakazakii]|nr:hypothetical protein [Cronobacter sakazakii]ELY6005194.1 hypothetical protein [Cronobacter sakazakii]